MDPRLLNTIGLGLIIVGSGMLWQFGLPPDFDPLGHQHIVAANIDEAEAAKGRRYRRNGRFGIGLVGLGSLLQLVAIWI